MFTFGKATGLAKRISAAFAAVVLLGSLVSVAQAQATPLNLSLQPAPDMFSDAIEVSYDAASQTFTASGFAEHIKNGAAAPTEIANGRFEITATINNNGEFAAGRLRITGEIPSQGVAAGTLLEGNLTALGFGDAGGVVEFQFATDGGSLAFSFGPSLKVILGQSGFTGTFARNFRNGATGVAGIGW